ncbi:MAG: hypothetical protein C3F07_16810 [Anaerolineales bacterium]|nr:hypothetical protein [Anaerolineae bacterium]PWB70495.1 MAG: hypothetical protein C3F07_16810 [Anaerolineales bacterium]
MKSFSNEDVRYRPDVIRMKWRMGMAYGIAIGLSFAAATWGLDGYQLSQAHGSHPWLKFIIGALICMTVGGAAGWLVARLEKTILALPIYLGVSLLFSWLTLALPFQIFPKVVALIDPETGSMLNYIFYENFSSRFAIAAAWVALFITLAGILQIPLTEPAAFSTSIFGRLMPLVVCAVIMFINGTIVDTLNNEPLRSAVQQLNQTIQFTVDHQGQEVDKALARTMRMSSLRSVLDVVDQPRQIIVGGYDPWLGQINVLVHFGEAWVDCVVVYNQPSFCQYAKQGTP